MPKVVKTPDGEKVVLTEEELVEIVENHRDKKYRVVDNAKVCESCGELICVNTVLHVGLLEIYDPSIKGLVKALEDEDLLEYKVGYCLFCDGIPDLVGLPVAMFGSFHNRPH